MKVCIYTISDLKEYSIKCIDLLVSSLNTNIPYDFFVISNKNEACKYSLIYDTNYFSDYVGYLKYSPLIPKNYQYYIYLDSDILYFDKISLLIPYNQKFSLVKEHCTISTNDWYYFDKVTDNTDRDLLQKCQAINAGSFAYSSDMLESLTKAYSMYSEHHNNDNLFNAKLEQQLYNYIVHKFFAFDVSQCKDITPITELFAQHKEPSDNKTLYHFCGFSGEMVSKYHFMRDFYDKYTRRNN